MTASRDHLCWQPQNGLLDMGIHPRARGPLGQNLGHRHRQYCPECARPGMSATIFFPVQLEHEVDRNITDQGITLMIRGTVIDPGGRLLFICQ